MDKNKQEISFPQVAPLSDTVDVLEPTDQPSFEDDDDLETQTNSEMLEVTEDLTLIRQLLARVMISRHKTVSMITTTLESADSRAEVELSRIIEATEPPQTQL